MHNIRQKKEGTATPLVYSTLLAAIFSAAMLLTSCGGTNVSSAPQGFGTVSVTISDPPTCSAPSGNFQSVYVTVRSVQAHTSATASNQSSGWQELAPQLVALPVQVDLLHLPANGQCLLSQLGSTSLPAGDYQQLRLLLLANSAPSGPAPLTNACASLGQVFNCVVDSHGVFHTLDLSSQDTTGLKIPPGQIMGGPIHVGSGQSVDINVDFDACRSVIHEGSGSYRLKPVLAAGQVSTNLTGISGQIVDQKTSLPIAGAMVAIEAPDSAGTDRIFMQALTDSSGRFSFCPLPLGATFDVVADAVNSSGVAYNATIVLNVPGGTNVGAVPLTPETGTPNGPGTIQGAVTAINGTLGANIDVVASAFQTIPLSGGASRPVTIPPLPGSTAVFTTDAVSPCPAGSPAGAYCGSYALVVPASNPSVGTFSAGQISYVPPLSGNVLYQAEARAFRPSSGGAAICSPSLLTTSKDASSQPLMVTAGAATTASRLDFAGCS
ncbi:MAG: DUF4382 domain-containing protein [Acidobacteriia bacterium]|nr:DUF4382 domain-containing protein [Terriglobia bacterium]